MRDDDAALVQMALSGDADAFSALVTRYMGAAFGLAFHILGDFEDARDIAQEAFIQAFANLSKLRSPEKFASWLHGIVVNLSNKWLCKKKRRAELVQAIPAADGPGGGKVLLPRVGRQIPSTPADELARKELREEVRAALDTLSDKVRLTMTLFYAHGLSYREIARFQDVPVSTVRGRIYEAKKKLKREMLQVVEESMRTAAPGREFTRRVLEGVRVYDDRSDVHTHLRALQVALEYLGVSGAGWSFLMGASGEAFRFYLHEDYHPAAREVSAVDVLASACRAAGRRYRWETDMVPGAAWDAVIAAVNDGRPVLTSGIGGPRMENPFFYYPLWRVIVGYDVSRQLAYVAGSKSGDVSGYDAVPMAGDVWEGFIIGPQRWAVTPLFIVGEQVERPPSAREVLIDSLRQAVALATTPRFVDTAAHSGARAPIRDLRSYLGGFAAYEKWLSDLRSDRDLGNFHAAWCHDQMTLQIMYTRREAACYLRDMAERVPEAGSHLAAASAQYTAIPPLAEELNCLFTSLTASTLDEREAERDASWSWDAAVDVMAVASSDPSRRTRAADLLAAIYHHERLGISRIEAALEVLCGPAAAVRATPGWAVECN